MDHGRTSGAHAAQSRQGRDDLGGRADGRARAGRRGGAAWTGVLIFALSVIDIPEHSQHVSHTMLRFVGSRAGEVCCGGVAEDSGTPEGPGGHTRDLMSSVACMGGLRAQGGVAVPREVP